MRRRTWGRRAGWLLLGVAMVAVSAWVVAHALVAETPEEFQRWTNWANVFALPIGMVSAAWLAFDRAAKANRLPATPAGQVDQVIEDLSRRLERDWAEEAVLREVTRPRPIRVRWSPTGQRSASQEVTFGTVEPAGSGEVLDELVTAYRRLPHRQLMVLGGAGAGKSVFGMLLTLGLLRSSSPSELPILLPITGWDPEHETVEAFVVRRLVANYADVLSPYGDPTAIAGRLATDRRIVPILDGLDELPAGVHAQAMNALDTHAAMTRPLVVTCRLDEYAKAVTRGRVLSQAAVVELEPVSIEAAIRYLSDPVPDARWTPLFEHLREEPDGQLARAFSSPLMVALARTAYQDPASDPAELLSLPTESAMTGRLMDAFLAAAYADPAPRRNRAARRQYPAGRATRWLTCLANAVGYSTDLYWWNITPGLMEVRPRRAQFFTYLAATAMVTLAAGLGAFLLTDGGVAVRAALAAAVLMAVPASDLLIRPLHSRYRDQRRTLVRHRVGYTIGCGSLTAFVTLNLTTTLLATLAYSLIAVWLPFWQGAWAFRRLNPTAHLRRARSDAASAALQYGLGGAAVFTLIGRFTDPTEQLLIGGTAAAVYGLSAALADDGRSWLVFQLTHARLALQGRLPWRLWSFLDDAHRRGVLRQTGTTYQFRHALLQDHLATAAKSDQLLARVGAGDTDALRPYFDLLVGRDGFDAAMAFLRSRADTDSYARWLLADHLARYVDVDQAIAVLEPYPDSWTRLADLLSRYDRHEQGIALLQPRADAGDEYAARRLAHVLAKVGRVDEGIAVLQRQAEEGDHFNVMLLNDLLAKYGRVDALRARAAAGDAQAAVKAAELVAADGQDGEAIAILSPLADDRLVVRRLADLLAGQGRVDEAVEVLRRHADAGDRGAVQQLVDLLTVHGRFDEAHALLQARADAGARYAEQELASWRAARRAAGQLR